MATIYHYHSELRPISQLPIVRLGWIFAEEFIGPESRDFLTAREATDFEVSQLSLRLVDTRES